MSFGQTYPPQGGMLYDSYWLSFSRSYNNDPLYENSNFDNHGSYNCYHNRVANYMKGPSNHHQVSRNYNEPFYNGKYNRIHSSQSFKRRKFSQSEWMDGGRHYYEAISCDTAPSYCNNFVPASAEPSTSAIGRTTGKRDRSKLQEDNDASFMSREEIERWSPSRKDGIDALHETRLRYSYCAFIQNLGMRVDLPQTTVGTAMVLCHRFFVRRSHACHDRYLVGTAALFLAAKSEETPQPLNNVLRASCEILHKQDITILSYMLPIDWFEQYQERVIEAEQLILTTLNFELDVQHPYEPLTSILSKLGLSQSLLVTMALNIVSAGLRSSLWLQFKPQHIAAGAAYLAGKFLNMDLDVFWGIWQEFDTPPAILHDVVKQLTELL